MVQIIGNDPRRSGKILVLILRLVLNVIIHQVIIAFRQIVDLGHKFPSLIFVGRSIVEYVMKGEISALSLASLVTYNEIIL